MKKSRLFELNDRGASLIAVLVAIVVVGVMGSVVMKLTITNLQMKEVERQSKKNFYSAEEFMGYLTNQINIQSGEELKESFNDMLARYKTVSQNEVALRKAFSKAYLDRMISYYGDTSSTASQKTVGDEVEYEINRYKVDAVTNLIYGAPSTQVPDVIKTSTSKYGFEIDEANAYYYADYVNSTFTLSNVCIFAKDDFGNKNKIQTDIVFHVPDINLSGNNVVKEFMRYSLIADDQLYLFTEGFTVDGNIYAGDGGIVCEQNQYGKLIGKKIVTRGDIVAHQSNAAGAAFQVGNDSVNISQIWANNFVTVKDPVATPAPGITPVASNGARLTISGDAFVADDLTINGNSDKVVIRGNYYGYNFQENYAAAERTEDSSYSSAILINGKDAFIDVREVSSIMVAGRAFIGRNHGVETGSNDILTGESISVKANQIAYYVPADCVEDDHKTIKVTNFYNFSGIPNVNTFLKSGEQVTEYHYIDGGGAERAVYYLNFKDDQSANEFFYAYYNNKKMVMISKANRYVSDDSYTITVDAEAGTTATYRSLQIDPIKNNPTIRGDYIYTKSDGTLDVRGTNILASLWGPDSIFYTFAQDHAIRYKSLSLTLEDNLDPSMASNVRITDADPTLFNNLIDPAQWAGFFAAHNSDTLMTDGYKYINRWNEEAGLGAGGADSGIIVALVNNTGEHNEVFTVPATYDSGLVIASGDVLVEHSFRGTIISGGTITVRGSASLIQADEVLISKIISWDANLKHDAVFSKIFKGYTEVAEEIMSGTSVEKYMTFDNWTKTVE